MYYSIRQTVQLAACVAALHLTSFQCAIGQGLLVNGDFDLPAPGVLWDDEVANVGGFFGVEAHNGGIPGWTVGPAFDGTYCQIAWWHVPRAQWAEIGYFFVPSGLQQTFATVPNQAYEVTFSIGTPNHGQDPALPGILQVSVENWGAVFTAPTTAGAPGRTPPFSTHKFYFEAGQGGTTTLLFQNLSQAVVLDSVSVTAIPEPSLLAMFTLAGLAGLGIRGLRRRNARSWSASHSPF